MKNYLSSALTGARLFPVYLIYLIATGGYLFSVIALSAAAQQNPESVAPSAGLLLCILVYVLVLLPVQYFLAKLYIESIEYRNERLVCRCTFGGYLRIVVPGILLCIVTLGIYAFWLQPRIIRFFADNTGYRNRPFRFNGLGTTLFGITLLAYLLPLIAVSVIAAFLPPETGGLFTLLLLLPIASFYTYLIYRWYIDITVNGITVRLKANNTAAGAGYILGQLLLTGVTLGFYLPAAVIRIYHYLVRNTEAKREDGTPAPVRIGYAPRIGEDYPYFLIQGIFTLVTLGVYGAWAIANVYRRMLGRTFIEEPETATDCPAAE